MEKFQAVIFDLDGTLLNTLEDLADSTNYALERMGFPARSIEQICSFVGNGVQRLIEQAVPEGVEPEQVEQTLKVFKLYYSLHKEDKTRPYDGIIELLSALKQENIRMAIISNKFDQAVKELNASWFQEYITIAVGESASVRKKPYPDSLFRAMNELGVTPEATLYVGDSEVDIAAAHNAGIKCASVTWGFRKKDFLLKHGADYIIETTEELKNFTICS